LPSGDIIVCEYRPVISACIIAFFSTSVWAAVVDINCTAPSDVWSFDYELQQLTFNETIFEVGRDPYEPAWGVSIEGLMDSGSTTLTVVKNLTNSTGVPWTSYVIEMPVGIVGGGDIVDGSAESTEFPEVTYELPFPYTFGIQFSGPKPVPDGQPLTIKFNVLTYSFKPEADLFHFNLKETAVPETPTISLLALGALILCRNQGRRRSTSLVA
jgi:hypothetical protein